MFTLYNIIQRKDFRNKSNFCQKYWNFPAQIGIILLITLDLETELMKKSFHPMWMLPFALLTGAVGLVLRMWLFTTGVDHKGLLVEGHIAGTLTFVLTGLVLGGLFLWLRQPLKKLSYERLFPASLTAAFGCWVAAAGIARADFAHLVSGLDRTEIFSLVLSVAAIVSLMFLGLCRMKGQRPHPALHAVVTVYFMFQLIRLYRLWSSETQLHTYFFQLLAAVFLMLAAFHRAELDAGIGKLNNWLFFRSGAVFFCLTALYDDNFLFYLAMFVWMFTEDCRALPAGAIDPSQLPQPVQLCMTRLEEAGFESYVVGGCVRDMLLELTPQDYDICTAATPEQTAQVFADCQLVRSGEKHGTIGVVIEGEVYEITTFRTEGGYTDSRHPDWVEFVSDVREDLSRRDFTVNAMAYSPKAGLIDPFDGREDLKKQILRAVGIPEKRFSEDALRILRGVRFASRYQLTPDAATEEAMLKLAPTMENLAAERVFSELCKLMLTATATDLLRYAPIITQVIPELQASVDFQQHNPHHAYDVYTHTAYVVENTPKELSLRLAALLHDVGKPATFTLDENGVGHFYDHASLSADMADAVLTRLKAPTALRQQVVLLIRQHMAPITPDEKLLRRRLAQYGEDTLRQLLALQKADRSAKGVAEADTDSDAALTLLEKVLAEQSCFSLKQLAVDGNDLIALGFAPGPGLGETLQKLLDMVVDQQIPNEKDALLKAAAAFKEETK